MIKVPATTSYLNRFRRRLNRAHNALAPRQPDARFGGRLAERRADRVGQSVRRSPIALLARRMSSQPAPSNRRGSEPFAFAEIRLCRPAKANFLFALAALLQTCTIKQSEPKLDASGGLRKNRLISGECPSNCKQFHAIPGVAKGLSESGGVCLARCP